MEKRERPQRRPIVPRWLLIAAVACIALLLVGTVAAVWIVLGSQTSVPDVVGTGEGAAKTKLSENGLEMEVTERRFDASEEGTVLEQDPAPDTQLPSGSTVDLVVSAGSDRFEMPDVTGQNVQVARGRLEDAGLEVKIETLLSDQPKDTVLATNPAPGATVRTGEIVRVTVAGESSATDALLPYQMPGATIVIDPSVTPDDSADTTMDVARKLQSLLQASGATVVLTRSSETTDTGGASRVGGVPAGDITAVIGLDIATTGAGGMSVGTLTEALAGAEYAGSTALADELQMKLDDAGYPSSRTTLPSDPVLQTANSAGLRHNLGSLAEESDAAAFRDPAWADAIARAIYQALGERFGSQ
jgi:N-acetylmuramoyl-L-alanine amidase